MLSSMQAGTEPASTTRKLTRRSAEEAEPQEVSRQAIAEQSAAAVNAPPDTANTAALEAGSAAEGAAASQTADSGASQPNADAPHALAEDYGVPDQAPLAVPALTTQTKLADGAAAANKGSWRRAEGSGPAAARKAAFPTAELADSLQAEDLEASDAGAALFSQPQLRSPAGSETSADAAAGELPVAGAGSASGDAGAAMLQRLQQQPNRVLDEAQVEAGISYVGHNARLRRLMRRLGQGEAITLGARTKAPDLSGTVLVFPPSSLLSLDGAAMTTASCMFCPMTAISRPAVPSDRGSAGIVLSRWHL